jgi:GTP-binding protein EngB required for normal cell division
VAAAILLTKADKLSRSARLQRRRAIAMTLPEDLPLILFSAPSRLGLDEARDQLLVWLGKAGHRETSQ